LGIAEAEILQVGCPNCHTTNSLEVLKELRDTAPAQACSYHLHLSETYQHT